MSFDSRNLKIVALGGGHGLAASLRALKTITPNLTAVVGVSDNGGSSGRLRSEFDVIPPGDLRMALIALCSESDRGRLWADVLQHRFSGTGQLNGHALGNLLITSLWQQNDDIVAGLDAVCELLEAQGKVLPLSLKPLDVVAEVVQADGIFKTVKGQVAIATAKGEIQNLRFEQQNSRACPEVIEALSQADVIVMGPGSWYTSVVNHLLLNDVSKALISSTATKILVTNMVSQTDETKSFTPAKHIDVLHEMSPDLVFDVVLVDTKNVSNDFNEAALKISNQVISADLADSVNPEVHNPTLLAQTIYQYLELSIKQKG
jgi:uncharacterized cofD-like protein